MLARANVPHRMAHILGPIPMENRLGPAPVENRLGRIPARNRLGLQWEDQSGDQEDQEDQNRSRSRSAHGRPSGHGFMQPKYHDKCK